MKTTARLFSILLTLVYTGCSDSKTSPGDALERAGDEIIAAGQLIHTGTKVVLWFDEHGYDAYRVHRHFSPDKKAPSGAPDRHARFGSFRRGLPTELGKKVKKQGWNLGDLRKSINQVVIHFDACGTSERCFEVLHDVRGLSCHFLLDLDGTIYQTLDLKERAWHAAEANNQSIGIEIAHIGAHRTEESFEEWYSQGKGGWQVQVPESVGRGNLPAAFAGKLHRQKLFRGTINGRDLVQRDFTSEQYAALEKLLLTLCRTFPQIRADVPRDARGKMLDNAFPTPEKLFAYHGLLGHYHISQGKVDPGPAFDWDRILKALSAGGISKD